MRRSLLIVVVIMVVAAALNGENLPQLIFMAVGIMVGFAVAFLFGRRA